MSQHSRVIIGCGESRTPTYPCDALRHFYSSYVTVTTSGGDLTKQHTELANMADPMNETEGQVGILSSLVSEIVESPLNICLLCVCIYLLYKLVGSRLKGDERSSASDSPSLPKMKKRDFTIDELKIFDGKQGDGRILIAVNGKVFDVTRGRKFYGEGGPYSVFGGRDASRGLATFSTGEVKDGYDDLSDLTTAQMDSVREWEQQFIEKYDLVGRLLKPGEPPHNYSDDEDEESKSKDA
ncbi:unnamed protein product [Darwinula stevensoni]|uniref:Cytochrome b5 heme-binding domain-containing protein n=1 Tax=Darwinula stevensoni TaxID=69355 RepID=A0A7R8XHU3_9CRUS|nr:unnamed protein product [Darwinula stevensoni]CAG0892828.1 unnamed protein product [Darwinula stevensoni]